jgi:hypothetical protein
MGIRILTISLRTKPTDVGEGAGEADIGQPQASVTDEPSGVDDDGSRRAKCVGRIPLPVVGVEGFQCAGVVWEMRAVSQC